MRRRRRILAGFAAGVLSLSMVIHAGAAAVSGAAASYTLSGTVTEAGCGHGAGRCTVLPKEERLMVGVSDSSPVASVPVDSSGHYSISLPAGSYFVTPGVRNGPVAIERFTPESRKVELGSDQTANFAYTVVEPAPLGYLHLSGRLENVAVTDFDLPQAKQGSSSFGPLELATAEVGLQSAIAAAVASGKVYPHATFDVFKHGTKTKALAVVMRGAQLTDESLVGGGTSIRLSLRAKEGSITYPR